MKAPFPYFGGKSKVAGEVWARFGDVPNYVEPFAGSTAVLLKRPDKHQWWERTETINDADGMVANFWRAVKHDPEAVAHFADWPVNENDLHARHGWLVGQRERITAMLEGDAEWYDAKVAGWWLWGICLWIGSGWCSGEGPWVQANGQLVHLGDDGRGINRQLVHLGNDGMGINRKLVHLGNDGMGINRKLVHLGNDGSKSERYWYDQEAIREQQAPASEARYQYAFSGTKGADNINDRRTVPEGEREYHENGRNKRSVWHIATAPFPEAHFATFPPALVEPCILAGSREGDVVLDPFIGSGTTAMVARNLGRRAIGIDLNAEYLAMAKRRVGEQLALLDGAR